jgi:hypothetical protein
MRAITISEEEGIKAVIGKPKGKDTTEVQSYLFDKSKGWTLDKARTRFEQRKDEEKVKLHEHVSALLPFTVLEKIVDKPLQSLKLHLQSQACPVSLVSLPPCLSAGS